MLPSILYAALVLAAPAGEPSVSMAMEMSPRKIIMLGDVVIVKITAINYGEKAVPIPIRYEPLFGHVRLEIGDPTSPYRYIWRGGGAGATGRSSLMPLAPGEQRVVFFEAIEFPPVSEIQHQFWTDLAKEKWRGATLTMYLGGHREIDVYRTHNSIEEIRPRPQAEVDALVEVYAEELPHGYDEWSKPTPGNLGLASFPLYAANPEKLSALEGKLSAGTLRDILRATRLMQILAVTEDNLHGDDAQRRAAAKELLALLDASAELERQWLSWKMFNWFYARIDHPDQIDREFMEAVAQRIPKTLLRKTAGHNPEDARPRPFLKRKQEAKAAGANEQTRARQ